MLIIHNTAHYLHGRWQPVRDDRSGRVRAARAGPAEALSTMRAYAASGRRLCLPARVLSSASKPAEKPAANLARLRHFAHRHDLRIGAELLVVAVGHIMLDVEFLEQRDARIHLHCYVLRQPHLVIHSRLLDDDTPAFVQARQYQPKRERVDALLQFLLHTFQRRLLLHIRTALDPGSNLVGELLSLMGHPTAAVQNLAVQILHPLLALFAFRSFRCWPCSLLLRLTRAISTARSFTLRERSRNFVPTSPAPSVTRFMTRVSTRRPSPSKLLSVG